MARAWLFGDAINTDQIIPGRFNVTTDAAALGAGCFIELRPEFHSEATPGDVVVAGRDFGCGSSREHAVIALQALGIGAVIAPSFARIFYRNAINRGLPLMECDEACALLSDGDQVEFDLDAGTIRVVATNLSLQARPLPAFVQRIVRHGGVLELVRVHGSLRSECTADCGERPAVTALPAMSEA